MREIRYPKAFTAIILVLLGWVLMMPFTATAQSPRQIEDILQGAVELQQEVQKEGDEWAREREVLLQEIRDLKNQKRWLEFQINKHREYIRREKAVIKELGRRERELSRINIALEPYLEEVSQRLASFVNSDMPFLPEERKRRLSFLRDALNDYHISLGEKLRRVLEALLVEANYGKGMEKTEVTLDLNGVPTEVEMLRLGRLALFFQTPDQKTTGMFDRRTRKWEILPSKYTRDVGLAMEMADRKRATELLFLPVGSPDAGEKVKGAGQEAGEDE